MHNRWKAHNRIDALAFQLAQELCDLCDSEEQIIDLWNRANQTAFRRLRLCLLSPDFQQRAADHRKREAILQAAESNDRLRRQLAEFGIDPEPIFSDGPLEGGPDQ